MVRQRKAMVKGLVVLLVLTVPSVVGPASVSGQAAGEVWIRPGPQAGQTIVVPAGDVGVIRYGWIAGNRWLVQLYFWAAGQEFVLTREGSPGWSRTITKYEVLRYLGPIERTPQYDGYCAWAASQNYKRPGDPQVWQIVDGKLYIKVHEGAQKKWRADIPKHIAAGDENWVRIAPY